MLQGANELFQYSDVLKNFRGPLSRPEAIDCECSLEMAYSWVRDTQLYHG